jgi:predicted nucleic acid-binding protein
MIFALDSNIILYVEGVNDVARQETAKRLILSAGIPNILVPLQALGETVRTLTRRLQLKKHEAIAMVSPWFENLKTQDTTRAVFRDATTLVAQYQFQFWDAIILSAAKAGGASILFSEDMQDGFIWDDVTILNPFSLNPNPIVTHLLSNQSH